jgi:hypothetical protein
MDSHGNTRMREVLPNYFAEAEAQFASLMDMDQLDQQVSDLSIGQEFEQALTFALRSAFGSVTGNSHQHLFLQRVLYCINRLKFFWYDDLSNYKNERSDYLRQVQHRI